MVSSLKTNANTACNVKYMHALHIFYAVRLGRIDLSFRKVKSALICFGSWVKISSQAKLAIPTGLFRKFSIFSFGLTNHLSLEALEGIARNSFMNSSRVPGRSYRLVDEGRRLGLLDSDLEHGFGYALTQMRTLFMHVRGNKRPVIVDRERRCFIVSPQSNPTAKSHRRTLLTI